MRAAVLALALAACAPDIVSGSYLCGPEQACPEDQKCNGPDHTCVTASTALPFVCPANSDHPDETPAAANVVPALTCVSTPFAVTGCLAAADLQDWFTFAVPAACGTTDVDVRLTFPLAFEPAAVELWDATGTTMIAGDGDCMVGPADGDVARCLRMQVAPGTSYAVVVKPAGGGDCDGRCANTIYDLSLRLAASI
jgi:hypothetical protein